MITTSTKLLHLAKYREPACLPPRQASPRQQVHLSICSPPFIYADLFLCKSTTLVYSQSNLGVAVWCQLQGSSEDIVTIYCSCLDFLISATNAKCREIYQFILPLSLRFLNVRYILCFIFCLRAYYTISVSQH